MDELTSQPKRRRPSEPPLIAMIGVLSMLIMFLIAGTIFGAATIELPTPYNLAEGHQQNELILAPQLIFVNSGFRLSFGDKNEYPLDVFTARDAKATAALARLRQEVTKFKSKVESQMDQPLNVVAERTTSYRTIFDVLKGLRDLGFTSMLFVSRYEENQTKGSK